MAPTPLMEQAAVAGWLGVSERTLEKWRVRGGGPPFTKVGRRVLYQPAAVQAWLDGRTYDRTPSPARGRAA